MVVMGFPIPGRPERGIFNLRAALGIKALVKVQVLFLRSWVPGRPLRKNDVVDDIPVTTVTAPQIPALDRINLSAYAVWGWPLVRDLFAEARIVHSVSADPAGVLSSFWARRAGKHHLVQIIGSDVYDTLARRSQGNQPFDWDRHVHAVTAVCRALAREFEMAFPHVPNIETTYRGTDLDQFHPEGATAGPFSMEKSPRFLFLGGFPTRGNRRHDLHRKSGFLLLDSWKEGEETLNRLGARLVLAGMNSDGPEVSRIVQSLNYPKRVVSVGAISPVHVSALLRGVDVIIVPSLEEGLPNVAVEASASGRAVIGSQVGGMSEVVEDGSTGLLLPPGDRLALTHALITAASDPLRIARMGKAARARAEALFDCRKFGPGIMDLYGRALMEPLMRGT